MKFKRKKNTRQRGSKTHGWGSMKKHRGAGHRGGRGMAGTGKRGDAKKPSIWKDRKYFGPTGFVSKRARKGDAANIAYIESRIATLVKRGLARQESGFFVINMADLGFARLLGKGSVKRKYRISCEHASPGAIEKIKKMGGEVNLPKTA